MVENKENTFLGTGTACLSFAIWNIEYTYYREAHIFTDWVAYGHKIEKTELLGRSTHPRRLTVPGTVSNNATGWWLAPWNKLSEFPQDLIILRTSRHLISRHEHASVQRLKILARNLEIRNPRRQDLEVVPKKHTSLPER